MLQSAPVLVTGAAGFIGFHVALRLLEQGHRVIDLDNLNAYYDPTLKCARALLPMQPGDMLETCADVADLEAAVGFRPNPPIVEGVRRFIAWYRSYIARPRGGTLCKALDCAFRFGTRLDAQAIEFSSENEPTMAAGLHEEYSRDYKVESASNKRFGLVVGTILLLFACVRAWLHGEIGWLAGVLGGIGLVLILAALIKPDALAGANRGWNKLGLVLHKVTNPLFLGAMYAIAIVPTGLLMRAFGADPMNLKRRGSTYWIAREKGGSTAQSLEKPF